MNAGQHLGNTEKILDNLEWKTVNLSDSSTKFFQVLNWLPDYVSLIDLFSSFLITGIIDYIPIYLPFLGFPSFNFFSMKAKLMRLSKDTICTSEEKLFHDFHFDSLTSFESIRNHWNWLEEISKKWLENVDQEKDQSIKQLKLFSLLAQTLHAVQDFYSHSNWVEYLFNTYQFSKKEEFFTWFDIFKDKSGTFKKYQDQLEQANLFTGYFPIGKDKKMFHIYHNDKKNIPGLNKDRAERPFFDVVYFLAIKNGVQWLNYIKEKYLSEIHLKLLDKQIPTEYETMILEIYPYIRTISYKLREYNGTEPFKNLSLKILSADTTNQELILLLELKTSEKLVKYDRDFRKSFFKIYFESDNKPSAVYYKFGNRTGLTKVRLKQSELNGVHLGNNVMINVQYGLLNDKKMLVHKN